MKLERVTILLLLSVGAVLAYAGSRWQSWSEAEPDDTVHELAADEGPQEPGPLPLPDLAPRLLSAEHHRAPAYFDPDVVGGMIHAEALHLRDGDASETRLIADAPAAVNPPREAIPIETLGSAENTELRELIDRELSEHAPADREVWVDVLKDLSLKEAAEILKIWKLTGGQSRLPSHLTDDAASPRSPAGPLSHPLPHRLEAAREVIRKNLTHLDDAGYLRGDPAATAAAMTQTGKLNVPEILDLTAGETIETRNPMHLAIAGDGFFILKQGDQLLCTKCGRFDLSETGALIQRRADGEWRLEPAISVPEDSIRVMIDSDGAVRAQRAGDRVADCGRIQLATFLNPQHLARAEADFLKASDLSGPLHRVTPGEGNAGRLRQGWLELSNANLEREHAALQRLDPQWKLPASAAPRATTVAR